MKIRRKAAEGNKTFLTHLPNKRLISRIYKALPQANNKNMTTQIFKNWKDFRKTFKKI